MSTAPNKYTLDISDEFKQRIQDLIYDSIGKIERFNSDFEKDVEQRKGHYAEAIAHLLLDADKKKDFEAIIETCSITDKMQGFLDGFESPLAAREAIDKILAVSNKRYEEGSDLSFKLRELIDNYSDEFRQISEQISDDQPLSGVEMAKKGDGKTNTFRRER